jgi:type II secretory pathway pseudopilin PulG
MNNRSKRFYWIEAIVATLVIVVLVLVMLPRFFRAQGGARVAKAMQDLATIANAMEAYNLSSDFTHLTFYRDKPGDAPFIQGYKRSVLPFSDYQQIFSHQFSTDILSEYLHDIPTPQPSFRTYSTHGYAREGYQTTVTEQKMMDSQYDVGLMYPRAIRNNLGEHIGFSLLQMLNLDKRYAGIYYGPRLDPIFDTHTTDGRFLIHGYYVQYNPTNGINSHGFTLYYSEPAKSVYKTAFRFEDAIPNYPKYPKDRSSWKDAYLKFDELRGARMNSLSKPLTAFKQTINTQDEREFAEYVNDALMWQKFHHECSRYKYKNLVEGNDFVSRTPVGFTSVDSLRKYAEFQELIWPFDWEVEFPIRITERKEDIYYFSDELLNQLRQESKQP